MIKNVGRYVSGMRDNFIFLKRVFQNSQGANSGITNTIIAVTINKYRNLFPIKVLTVTRVTSAIYAFTIWVITS